MRNTHTHTHTQKFGLFVYMRVSQIGHNKKIYHKARLVRKSKCNEYDASKCEMTNRHKLVTP
jgi:hypothetical protein